MDGVTDSKTLVFCAAQGSGKKPSVSLRQDDQGVVDRILHVDTSVLRLIGGAGLIEERIAGCTTEDLSGLVAILVHYPSVVSEALSALIGIDGPSHLLEGASAEFRDSVKEAIEKAEATTDRDERSEKLGIVVQRLIDQGYWQDATTLAATLPLSAPRSTWMYSIADHALSCKDQGLMERATLGLYPDDADLLWAKWADDMLEVKDYAHSLEAVRRIQCAGQAMSVLREWLASVLEEEILVIKSFLDKVPADYVESLLTDVPEELEEAGDVARARIVRECLQCRTEQV